MISEIEFVRDHTSFWRTLSPLSDEFVRQINAHILNRYHRPIVSIMGTSRRAMTNEVGFEIFTFCRLNKISIKEFDRKILPEITAKASMFISTLRNAAPHYNPGISEDETDEVLAIATNLSEFFNKFETITFGPNFRGCGKLASCRGDVIADGILYEIKSGGRSFRSLDLRQLALYFALNFLSHEHRIDNLGLYNPRQGFHFQAAHQQFALRFSGLSTEELCHRITYELLSANLDKFVMPH